MRESISAAFSKAEQSIIDMDMLNSCDRQRVAISPASRLQATEVLCL